jgi:hypothetical protein
VDADQVKNMWKEELKEPEKKKDKEEEEEVDI